MFNNFKDAYFHDHEITIELEEYQHQQIKALVKQLSKGTASQVEGEWNYKTFAVQFFLKEQSKVKAKGEDGSYTGKAGQGVSATSKTYNTMYSSIIRMVQHQIRKRLREGVFMANGMEETSMFAPLTQIDMQNAKFIESDVKEMDTTQDLVTLLFVCMIMEFVGIPDDAIKLYAITRIKFPVVSLQLARMLGELFMRSGSPETLDVNTLLAMALISDPEVFIGVRDSIVMAKGDDLLVIGNDLKVNNKALRIQEHRLNIRLEMAKDLPPQFVGYFITNHGPIPDLVRMAMKVKSKPLKDKRNMQSNKYMKIVHWNNKAGEKYTINHNKLDYNKLQELFDYLSDLDVNVVYHYMTFNSMTTQQYNILWRLCAHFKLKMIVHMDVTPDKQAIKERQLSVKDRIKKINSPEKFALAVSLAAKYYHVSELEVEKIYFWLQSIAQLRISEFARYYARESKPTMYVRVEDEKYGEDKVKKRIEFRRIDNGGNGDCFWRCEKRFNHLRGKQIHGIVPFPEKWVDVVDAVVNADKPLSILTITHRGNIIYTNSTGRFPDLICEGYNQQSGETLGHYYSVQHGQDEVIEYDNEFNLVELVDKALALTKDEKSNLQNDSEKDACTRLQTTNQQEGGGR